MVWKLYTVTSNLATQLAWCFWWGPPLSHPFLQNTSDLQGISEPSHASSNSCGWMLHAMRSVHISFNLSGFRRLIFFLKLRFFHFIGWNSMLGKCISLSFLDGWSTSIYLHAIGRSPINSKSFSEMTHTSLQYLEVESPVSTLNIRPCPKHPTPCRTRSRGAFGCRIWPQSWLSRLKRGFLCRPQCGRAPPSGGKLWGQGVKHMPVGYQGYASGWNGWALQGLNSTSKEN